MRNCEFVMLNSIDKITCGEPGKLWIIGSGSIHKLCESHATLYNPRTEPEQDMTNWEIRLWNKVVANYNK